MIKQKGFSLIELLVVISIIGILTTLTIVNYVGIRERARDSERKSDLNRLSLDLEVYKIDEGSYPLTADFPGCGNPLDGPTTGETYTQEIPCDPNGGSYTYASDGVTYDLTACLENNNDSEKDSTDACGTPTDELVSFTKVNP